MKPTKEQFQAAITKIEKFSPAPRILARALALWRDPQSPIRGIAELIGRDPAFTADLLRCSNSAFYGRGVQIQSIDPAVQKIGFRETVRLLSLAVSRLVTGCNLTSYGLSADDFWSESLFHGLFMEELARATGGPNRTRPTRPGCCGTSAGSRSTRASTILAGGSTGSVRNPCCNGRPRPWVSPRLRLAPSCCATGGFLRN